MKTSYGDESCVKAVSQLFEKAIGDDAWGENSLFGVIGDDNGILLIAKENSEVVGALVSYASAYESELAMIAVDEDFRGRGYAKMLMDDYMEILDDRGVAEAFLEVREHNEAAISLYESYGYVNVGVRPNFYQNPAEDAYILKKDLR